MYKINKIKHNNIVNFNILGRFFMQKHLLKLFLASICIFTLTGCNQKNDEIKNSATNKEQVEDAEEKVIEELQENAVKNEKKIFYEN